MNIKWIGALVAFGLAVLLWAVLDGTSASEGDGHGMDDPDVLGFEDPGGAGEGPGGATVHRDRLAAKGAAAEAEGEPTAAAAAGEGGSGVRGRLLDQAGLGVPDATVEVHRRRAKAGRPTPDVFILNAPGGVEATVILASVRSDASGGFELHGLPVDRNLILEVAHGLLLSPRRQFQAAAEEVKDLGAIRLRLGAAVTGQLLDTLNQPVADAWVRAESTTQAQTWFGYSGNSGRGEKQPRSDERGHFRIGPLDPRGNYRLAASAAATPATRRDLGELLPGQVLDLGAIIVDRGDSLAGRVLDGGGEPAAGVTVQAYPQSEDYRVRNQVLLDLPPETDTEGQFQIHGLDRGSYRLQARKKGAYASAKGVQWNAQGVELRFSQRGHVAGVVVDAKTGAPLVAARVELQRGYGGGFYPPSGTAVPSDENGAFRFDDLQPAKYRIRAWTDRHAPAETDAIDVPVSGVDGVRLALEVGAALRVQVVAAADESPVGGASLVLIPGDSRGSSQFGNRVEPGAWQFEHAQIALDLVAFEANSSGGATPIGPPGNERKTATTDEEGRAVISGLGPGHFRLVVEHEEFARTVSDLEMGEEPERRHSVQMIGGGTLVGKVLTFRGEPAVGQDVRVSPRKRDGPARSHKGRSGEDGTFTIEHLAPGEYLARLAAPPRRGMGSMSYVTLYRPGRSGNQKEDRVEFEIADGATTEVELREGPIAELSVTVLDDGQPASKARVSLREAAEGQAGARMSMLGLASARPVDAEGRVRFERLTPGRYELTFGPVDAHVPGSKIIELAAEEKRELTVELPTGSIAGLVAEEPGGEPLAGIEVRVVRAGGGAAPVANHVIGWSMSAEGGVLVGSAMGGAKTVTDSRGRFKINNLPAGDYALELKKAGYCDARSDALVLAENQHLDGVRQVMGRAGRIAGRVIAGGGTSPGRARVTATPLGEGGEPAGKASSTRAKRDGRYELGGLRPGRYRVQAQLPSPGDGKGPPAPKSSAEISVEPGATASLDLRF